MQRLTQLLQENKLYLFAQRLVNNRVFRVSYRAGRVMVLTTAVYQLGYQGGISFYAKSPLHAEKILLAQVLEVRLQEQDELLHSADSADRRRLQRIVDRIVAEARRHCLQKFQEERIKRLSSSLPSGESSALPLPSSSGQGMHPRESSRKSERPVVGGPVESAEEIFWATALQELQGEWQCVLSRQADANAFVTGLLPRKVFVKEGLLRALSPSDDELAVVLAHEIAHVVLGHTGSNLESADRMQALLLGLQLVLLSAMDLTGLLSFLLEVALDSLRKVAFAAYSRQHESQADELGVRLAHGACFDVRGGISVFHKIASLQSAGVGNGNGNGNGDGAGQRTGWTDTHPASEERFVALRALVEEQHMDRSSLARCWQVRSDLHVAWKAAAATAAVAALTLVTAISRSG